MAGQNWQQKFVTNPVTSNLDNDLFYCARSPYGATDDAVINWQNFSAQFLLSAGVNVTGVSQTIAVNRAYVANNVALVTFTLPATAAVGSTFEITGSGAGGWTIAQNANQILHVGSSASTTGVAGSVASTNRYDNVKFRCIVANLEWSCVSAVGNLTVT